MSVDSDNKKVLLVSCSGGKVAHDLPLLFKSSGFLVDILCPRYSLLRKNNSWDQWFLFPENIDAGAEVLEGLTAKGVYDGIFLVDDATLAAINERAKEGSLLCRALPLSEFKHRSLLSSKIGLSRACQEEGLPTPSFLVCNSPVFISKQVEALLPALLKEDRSSGGHGISYCETREELSHHLARARSFPILIQSYVQGRTVAVEALYRRGILIAWASSYVLKTIDGAFGPSYVREYFRDPILDELVVRLGERIRVHGFASMTFIKDEGGRYYIIEADLRAHSWFRLARFAGVDFGKALSQFSSGAVERLPRNEVLDGVVVHNFPREVLALLQETGVRELSYWVLNIEGRWRFIAHQDTRFFVWTIFSIASSYARWFYAKPSMSLFREGYRRVKNVGILSYER